MAATEGQGGPEQDEPAGDVMAVLADLQTQVDELSRALAAQQQVLDRLLADREQAKD